MASTARIDELKKKFDENPRRYFAPLANEFRKAGDIEQAIVICEEFLPQQPAHMSGHIVYGQALYEAGRLPESRTVFETALGLDPENLIALRHLGDIARGEHDGPAARSWYVRVLDADPRNEEIQALIAGLDGGDATADSEVDAPLIDMQGSPSTGLGFDIEKEAPPFEGAITREAPAREAPPLEGAITREVPARPMVDPSMADTAPAGVPIIPAAPVAPLPAPQLLDGFSMHGFDEPSSTGGAHHRASPALGLESSEFVPPSEHVPAADLDATLETGIPSFQAPAHRVESIDGLQGSGGDSHAPIHEDAGARDVDGPARLDLEGGLIPPTSTDAVDAPSGASTELIDFDLSFGAPAAPSAHEPHERTADEGVEAADVSEATVPFELPPAVISAEAELIEAGESPAPEPVAEDDDDRETVARPPFVTETMAELYLAQGFHEQALSVYSDLLAASPDDQRLAGIVASLSPAQVEEDEGPSVRDFLARIAGRRPGSSAAALEPPAYDDFADEADESPVLVTASDEVEEVTTAAFVASTSDEVAPALERAAAMHQPDGSIDALFGTRTAGTSEDSAAAALAQAFGGGTDAAAPPPIVGRPARAAKGELSLDSVFRDGGPRSPRTSQSFSFDQFFAGGEDRTARSTPSRGVASPTEGKEMPAERGADDIEQFNSWLQGLKQR